MPTAYSQPFISTKADDTVKPLRATAGITLLMLTACSSDAPEAPTNTTPAAQQTLTAAAPSTGSSASSSPGGTLNPSATSGDETGSADGLPPLEPIPELHDLSQLGPLPAEFGEWVTWLENSDTHIAYEHKSADQYLSISLWRYTDIDTAYEELDQAEVIGSYYCGIALYADGFAYCITPAGEEGHLNLATSRDVLSYEEMVAVGNEFIAAWASQ